MSDDTCPLQSESW